jgi:hypothetical protein
MHALRPAAACAAIAAALSLSCATAYKDVYPTLIDGKYDSEFPYRGCSAQLEEICESVKMVNTIAYYRTYYFTAGDRVRVADVSEQLLRDHAGHSTVISSQAAGTATVISSEGRRVVLMTCAHVIAFPETVTAFHSGPDRRHTEYLRSFALKEKQSIYVAGFPDGGDLEVLGMDRGADVALLGRTFDQEPFPRIKPLAYPTGRARELEWGSFVYLFGYPSGFRMVTKGIVSNPNRDKKGGFLLDAVFNRGFSGGIALAIRDGVPNFEFVGMVKLVSGHSDYVLAPAPDEGLPEYESGVPYAGEVYVERRTDIEYGIAQAISAETIGEIVERYREAMNQRGYVVRFPTGTPAP